MAINTGDTVWVLVSAALVMLMTPGVALFYGGLVRSKNVISTLMMNFSILALIGILWVLFGYSLAFGPDKGSLIGGLEFIGLRGVGQEPSSVYAQTVPHLAFMVYQGMFAIVTVALISGAVVERIKFSAFLLFSILWVTLVYFPVSHWVWGSGGWLGKLGVLDFAGGTVVHVNAGVSALALAMVLGARKGFPKDRLEPHHLPLVVLGAALLWFGWFGFNGGSALTGGGLAASAFVATNIAGCAGALTWLAISWLYQRPTVLGTATGALAGLAAVTPGAGFIPPMAGLPIGVVAAVICYFCMSWRAKRNIDESLDVWAVHGMGGAWGTIAVGIFASVAVNPAGANGLLQGNWLQLAKQALGVAVVWVYSFGVAWILAKVIHASIGLRVREEEEDVGLDISQHREKAYGGTMR